MNHRRFHHLLCRGLFAAAAALGLLLFTAGSARAAVPADAAGHWAKPAIANLIRRKVVVGYPDGTFKPDRFVSRAEFARMAVKAFGLSSPEGGQGGKVYADTAGHWAREDVAALTATGAMAPYQDGTFKPDRPITRSEIVAALDRLLGFGTKEQVFGGNWPASYPDVPESDPNFRLVELGRRLGYMPPSYAPSFLPGALVTRAEAAWMLDRIQRMKRIRGSLTGVEPDLGVFTIDPDGEGGPVTVRVDPEALVLRNEVAVGVEKILAGDRILAFIDEDNQARAIKASGKPNTDDLFARLNALTKGVLTPETVAAILAGDWDAVRGGLETILFDRLVEMGLSPGEAQSLLARDWVTLDLLSREELTQALSSRLGISTELAEAILSRDLARVKELLQTELVALALGRLLLPKS